MSDCLRDTLVFSFYNKLRGQFELPKPVVDFRDLNSAIREGFDIDVIRLTNNGK